MDQRLTIPLWLPSLIGRQTHQRFTFTRHVSIQPQLFTKHYTSTAAIGCVP